MRYKPHRFAVAIWVTFVAGTAPQTAAQIAAINGSVVDAAAGTPLPGANVFIANTTLGSATREDGTFRIEGPPTGMVDIVASMVGYQPQTISISILEAGPTPDVDFRLEERVFAAGEAVVSARRPRDWKRNLKRFTRELLGTSANAEDTKILNPYVLDFIVDSEAGTLQAFASEPLQIENRALGYDLIFVLDDFLVTDYPYSIRYRGSPRFKPYVSDSEYDANTIEKHRREAYLGSFRHFLVSLSESSLEKEGFVVRSGKRIETSPSDLSLLPTVEADRLVARGTYQFERQIYSPDVLHIVYKGEPEPGKYRRFVREASGADVMHREAQTSYLEFDHGVTMHTTGYLYDPYAVTILGYWVWERLADTLPRDYRPERSIYRSNGP